jgi:NAD(P)-dependent dehydrogenase (short-subunit alcohol dehydrogenase family)
MTVLREGLLRGKTVALAGGSAPAIGAALKALGAEVRALDPLDDDDGAWARKHAPLHALVVDAGGPFGEGAAPGLTEALGATWLAIRAVAATELVEGGGKVVLLGPRPGAGPFAEAARAALENLARTLSVEWARYAVTTTMIAPGDATTDGELAELVCFLVSPAGDYLSGCRLSLGERR